MESHIQILRKYEIFNLNFRHEIIEHKNLRIMSHNRIFKYKNIRLRNYILLEIISFTVSLIYPIVSFFKLINETDELVILKN